MTSAAPAKNYGADQMWHSKFVPCNCLAIPLGVLKPSQNETVGLGFLPLPLNQSIIADVITPK